VLRRDVDSDRTAGKQNRGWVLRRDVDSDRKSGKRIGAGMPGSELLSATNHPPSLRILSGVMCKTQVRRAPGFKRFV